MKALVMELVEGPTLADRIAQGAIPLDEALQIAKQIAEALEYAHERGIIHRDLKPANVKLTIEGKVKVLDFGLAKAMTSEGASNLSNSPTLSLAATAAGIVMGTAAYMSPEQAKGKNADRRADIWAFGVVLYEMLGGKMLFPGETAAESMALVIAKDLDWTALPANVPAPIRELLRRCLTKDPRNRMQAIGDARIIIEETIAHPVPELPTAAPAATIAHEPKRRALPWATAALLGLALVAALVALWLMNSAAPAIVRINADLGADVALDQGNAASAVLSPDGSLLAFTGRPPGGRLQIYVRRLDQLKATPLSGTEGARNLFFNPDGKWIGFFADAKLKKMSVTGGAAVALADVINDRGGWWGEDENIYFASDATTPIFKVSSAGGMPEQVTHFEKVDKDLLEITHRWPQVLPGGDALLFTAHTTTGAYEDASIIVQSLKTGERRVLQRGGFYARYLSSGHIAYTHDTALFVAPFDLKTLQLTAQPLPVIEGITTASNNGTAQFASSDNGSVVYLPGINVGGGVFISWPIMQAR